MNGSVLEGRTVMEIHWPNNCLLVALERDGQEMIPARQDKAYGRRSPDGNDGREGCRIYT